MVSYTARHKRVMRARGPARDHPCEHCDEDALDWARLHDRSGDDPEDYIPLCRSCHNRYDGRGDPGLGQRRAAQQRAKEHCPKLHEYTEDNIYWVGPPGKKRRQCKRCTRDKSAAAYQARKVARRLA